MKNKYLLASTPIFLGLICIITSTIIGSRLEPDGTLVEPFFLIPLTYIFVFIGIISLSSVAIFSAVKKRKHN
ncbi:hypothetical protein Curi_c11030 [Gottschalkia acidurici 9a]|uniref:DUF3955 domain-containing protein n=1 Tax=Gottschalkia acidurici (strain ATCC 7906 / DSM 604 / BCRC 14475 / CIP 104303 / KCTC 5404 / NCIMB 10678 / 9a) TaxID=1128398 RepID=K0AZ97_GOTA9|nr:DUF3955 domain-containing protein [Gottschalkia acidurici]AFS78117.1 hypothetical protein Curi_c11030 [Gottschalkia acidurici 9a]